MSEMWVVQLPDHPLLFIQAPTRGLAVVEYNRQCGVTQTSHPHTVHRVVPEPAEEEAKPAEEAPASEPESAEEAPESEKSHKRKGKGHAAD